MSDSTLKNKYTSFFQKPDIHLWLFAAIMLSGLVVRLCFSATVPWGSYQHDVGGDLGHKAVIEYIAGHLRLNSETNSWQYSHPQLHYIICAVVYRIAQLFSSDINVIMSAIETFCVFASMISVFAVYKTLLYLFKDKTAVLFGTFLYTFMPSNILMSRYLNNDSTLIVFTNLSIMFAVKWYKTKKISALLLTALLAAFAMSSKASGIILIPILGLLFLFSLAKERFTKENILLYLRNFGTFLLVFIPLPAYIFGRMYVLFNQPLGFISTPGGLPETGSPLSGFYFPLNMLENPFAIDPFAENIKDLIHYPEYLLKTALFGEFRHSSEKILLARIVIVLAIVLLAAGTAFCIYRVFSGKIHDFPIAIFIAAGVLIPVIFHIGACISLPYACTFNYRYLAPFMVFTVIILTRAFIFASKKGAVLRYLSAAFLLTFAISSSLFYLYF